MLKPIAKLPHGVVGFTAKGRVTAQDYESILIPAMESALKTRKKLRCLYHLGPDFSDFSAGALWEDATLGLRTRNVWEKIAIISDVGWIRTAVNAFRFALPGQIRVFSNQQLADAKAWIAD
ncbi:MAG: STAS/SEC14 domain-containing protein [Gammaproteobacteria bacterium]|nr:STAS/SEC14 domain-containing protein [Gammaproteobacteria bacterium]